MSSTSTDISTGAAIDELFDKAQNALTELQNDSPAPGSNSGNETAVTLSDIIAAVSSPDSGVNLDAVKDIQLDVRVILGEAELTMEEIMRLRKGSVVPLNTKNSDPVSIVVNGQTVARGEVLARNGKYCIRLLEIFK